MFTLYLLWCTANVCYNVPVQKYLDNAECTHLMVTLKKGENKSLYCVRD